jgi:D-alanyl-lipoteichoic acid acyltransferase DltB (MBOAT superfamily)
MLVYFKYLNLIASTVASLMGADFTPWSIVLPAGISFFSFRSISYIVDLYRGRMEPCRSLPDYLFFLTFFPPLLAGPVVRAVDFLPQIRQNAPATHAMVSEGLFLVMCGLVKKVVIADYISGNFVDRIFDNPALYSGFENLMGAIAYTLQLYCDFSGYSDMAIGLALMLGYRFKDNFNAPFKSQSPTDFWRRWHISLSTWLRDYIYIPLGGNRRGSLRQYANLLATMLLGGLWHGASWMYLLWGGYHGVLLSLHKLVKKLWRLPASWVGTRPVVVANIMITMVLTVAGMMLFRSPSLSHVAVMWHQILTDFRPQVVVPFIQGYPVIVALLVAGYMLHFLPRRLSEGACRHFTLMPLAVQALLLAVVLFVVIQTRQSSLVPFLYLKY